MQVSRTSHLSESGRVSGLLKNPPIGTHAAIRAHTPTARLAAPTVKGLRQLLPLLLSLTQASQAAASSHVSYSRYLLSTQESVTRKTGSIAHRPPSSRTMQAPSPKPRLVQPRPGTLPSLPPLIFPCSFSVDSLLWSKVPQASAR